MKRLFGPASLGGYLSGILPPGIFNLRRRTPWYRRNWMTESPWIGGVLAAPLVVFLVWKGVDLLLPRARGGQQSETEGH